MSAITVSKAIVLLASVLLMLSGGSGSAQIGKPDVHTAGARGSFIENRGQWDNRVLFRSDAGQVTTWFACDGVYTQFIRRREAPTDSDPESLACIGPYAHESEPGLDPLRGGLTEIETRAIRGVFVGAGDRLRMIGVDMQTTKYNYFLGNDSSSWRTGVPSLSLIHI